MDLSDDMSTPLEQVMHPRVPDSTPLATQDPETKQADEPGRAETTVLSEQKQQMYSQDTLRDAVIVVCVFWIFSSPIVYEQVNSLVSVLQDSGLPSHQGLVLHGLVAGLVFYLTKTFLV